MAIGFNLHTINLLQNKSARNSSYQKTQINFISKEVIKTVRNFHRSLPQYKITPLHRLKNLAKHLNVDRLWVKDESYRFELNAFKVLGASYAIANFFNKNLALNLTELKFNKIRVRNNLFTFVTATDGNHGRAVAWNAKIFNQKAVIFMPKDSSLSRIENIKKEGAKVIVTDVNYDETVKMAKNFAEKHDFIVIQDTAWEGYEQIPTWIMQGYITLIDEVLEQLSAGNEEYPTHVFLQVGVGSFAAAIQSYLNFIFGKKRPITITIEPDSCASIFRSYEIGDGKPYPIKANYKTIMAGLACGTPNPIAWKILRDYIDFFLTCSDDVSVNGMRILAQPNQGDPKIISGESGAVGFGIVTTLFQNECYSNIIEKLNIDNKSRLLVISTEGDTDPENYKRIVDKVSLSPS